MPGSGYTLPPKLSSVMLRWAASSLSTGPGTRAALAAGTPGAITAAAPRPATARMLRRGFRRANRMGPSYRDVPVPGTAASCLGRAVATGWPLT